MQLINFTVSRISVSLEIKDHHTYRVILRKNDYILLDIFIFETIIIVNTKGFEHVKVMEWTDAAISTLNLGRWCVANMLPINCNDIPSVVY